MVKVVHELRHIKIEKEAGQADFMLANRRGSYLYLSSSENKSRFEGMYFLDHFRTPNGKADWELSKTLESIQLELPALELRNHFHSVARVSGSQGMEPAKETFYVMENDALFYSLENYTGNISLLFDCRKMYDLDDKGRIYKISSEGDSILIEYTKYKDDSLAEQDYKIFIAIKGSDSLQIVNAWEKKNYSFDTQRSSYPDTLYVYNAIKIPCEGKVDLFFGFAKVKDEAVAKANYAYQNHKHEIEDKKKHYHGLLAERLDLPRNDMKIAHACAVCSLDHLTKEIDSTPGIFAGLPWFYQFWVRDEAISLGAHILEGNLEFAKKVIFRHFNHLAEDGRTMNRYPRPALSSADGIGWSAIRLGNLVDKSFRRKGVFDKKFTSHLFSESEILYLKDKLEFSIKSTINRYESKGLIENGPLETWMDTSYGSDTRSGKRIEIQCLFLAMIRTARKLSEICHDKDAAHYFQSFEQIYAKRIREIFFDGAKLFDGLDDPTQRPNIFLAYYAYPNLLSKSEWQLAFSYALERIWLEWGGLATIDKSSQLFTSNYTGENNKSYHRGDSWFFVNNIAAIAMHRVNKRRFSKFITKIIDASSHELLFLNVISHHAEVSSASELKSQGCQSQAWSCSTFIELMHEISTSR